MTTERGGDRGGDNLRSNIEKRKIQQPTGKNQPQEEKSGK